MNDFAGAAVRNLQRLLPGSRAGVGSRAIVRHRFEDAPYAAALGDAAAAIGLDRDRAGAPQSAAAVAQRLVDDGAAPAVAAVAAGALYPAAPRTLLAVPLEDGETFRVLPALPRRFPYPCRICDACFETDAELADHKAAAHAAPYPVDAVELTYRAKVLPEARRRLPGAGIPGWDPASLASGSVQRTALARGARALLRPPPLPSPQCCDEQPCCLCGRLTSPRRLSRARIVPASAPANDDTPPSVRVVRAVRPADLHRGMCALRYWARWGAWHRRDGGNPAGYALPAFLDQRLVRTS